MKRQILTPSHVFLTHELADFLGNNNNKGAQRTLFDGGPLRKCTHPTQTTSDLCDGNFLAFVYSGNVHCLKLLCHKYTNRSLWLYITYWFFLLHIAIFMNISVTSDLKSVSWRQKTKELFICITNETLSWNTLWNNFTAAGRELFDCTFFDFFAPALWSWNWFRSWRLSNRRYDRRHCV